MGEEVEPEILAPINHILTSPVERGLDNIEGEGMGGQPPSKPRYVPKPPKRKRKIDRRRKNSSYHWEMAREELGVTHNLQVYSAAKAAAASTANDTTSATINSPSKEEVKAENKKLMMHTITLEREVGMAKRKVDCLQTQVKSLSGSLNIPSEPPLKVPTRVNLPILGTQTHQVQKLDGQYVVNENSYKMKARKTRNERELQGEGSIHESMQSWFPPALCDLVDERIDVLAGFVMPDTIERDMRWCQGKVIEVHDEKKNTVKVCWDPIPDCAGWETSQETLQKLPPAKWNKNVDGAWRMDLPIEFNDTSDEEEEEEEDEGCEDEDETEMSDSDCDSES